MALVLFMSAAGTSGAMQSGAGGIDLPRPTGAFPVGRVTFHWSDESRREPVTLGGGARELMVDVWYPADSSTDGPAPYVMPSLFGDSAAMGRLQGYLRGAFAAVREGRVRTHATEGAPFARSLPQTAVLIFSHGGGEMRETYTTQLVDLASHGYIVAAISHTHEAAAVSFSDGRRIVLTPNRWPRPTVSEIEGLPPSQEANPDRLRWWADDIRFVFDQLIRVSGPVAGRLDMSRVGAFGHSAGGQAAAHACQIDQRLRACLNQDGLSGAAPYYLDNRGWGMDQPFMLLMRNTPRELPTTADLAAMKMTLEQARRLRAALDSRQEATLRNTAAGAYRVMLQAAGTTHDDFGDLPYLQATSTTDADTRARVLHSIAEVTRAFFHAHVKGLDAPLLDGRGLPEFIEAIERFQPARRPATPQGVGIAGNRTCDSRRILRFPGCSVPPANLARMPSPQDRGVKPTASPVRTLDAQ